MPVHVSRVFPAVYSGGLYGVGRLRVSVDSGEEAMTEYELKIAVYSFMLGACFGAIVLVLIAKGAP